MGWSGGWAGGRVVGKVFSVGLSVALSLSRSLAWLLLVSHRDRALFQHPNDYHPPRDAKIHRCCPGACTAREGEQNRAAALLLAWSLAFARLAGIPPPNALERGARLQLPRDTQGSAGRGRGPIADPPGTQTAIVTVLRSKAAICLLSAIDRAGGG